MVRRLTIELEAPEELLMLAAMLGSPCVMLDVPNSVLFLPDRGGSQVYFARLGDGSPWSRARYAVINSMRSSVRPSDEPSMEPGEVSVRIIRVKRIRERGKGRPGE